MLTWDGAGPLDPSALRYGRDGGALTPLLPLLRLGLGGRLGSGRQDLVGLLRRVLKHPDAVGPINGVAPEPVTNATFTAELGRTLRRNF